MDGPADLQLTKKLPVGVLIDPAWTPTGIMVVT
jgi:hypothetical protein